MQHVFEEMEVKKLSAVTEVILDNLNVLSDGLEGKRKEVLESRKEMWREARIVLRDFDDVADLTIFTEDLAQQENKYAATSKEILKLSKMLNSPYFARIDFTEEYGIEEIYIGRHSLFDDNTKEYHVYDWRAPISSLYYDYGIGDASFFVPGTGERIHGKISLKRQYQIEKGELQYLFDNDIAIEDEILRLELSKASDAHIKTIINTIQADQNKAIRSEDSNILVLGAAGSGKTSVGLHRLAYLLYRERTSLTSSKVRIFSPSPIFASYIEGIIPELGEDDVMNLDFPSLLEMCNSHAFHGFYQQIEYLSESLPDDTRRTWLAHKYSPEFLDRLESLVTTYTPSFEDVIFFKDVICPKSRLESLYQNRTATSTLSGKTSRIINYVNQCYEEYFNDNRPSITKLFDDIHGDSHSDFEIRSKFDEQKNIVTADLKNRLKPQAKRLYERHLKAYGKEHKLDIKFSRDALRMDKLYYEDALAVLYINLLVGRTPSDKTVKHILLDEAQDLSHLHHRILRKLYVSSHFTVLADTNQALYTEINITDPEILKSLYPEAVVYPLTKSYRSTYEINSFAAKLLQVPPQSFARRGTEPEIIKSADQVKTCAEVLSNIPKELNTIGILLPTAKEAKAFYGQIKEIADVNLISTESHNFAPGVMVMAVPFAKGLEFDAVICPNYDAFSTPAERKLLYLICTRALHRLYLISS